MLNNVNGNNNIRIDLYKDTPYQEKKITLSNYWVKKKEKGIYIVKLMFEAMKVMQKFLLCHI